MGYARSEHVLELMVSEAATLIGSAWIVVERKSGVWLCENSSFERVSCS